MVFDDARLSHRCHYARIARLDLVAMTTSHTSENEDKRNEQRDNARSLIDGLDSYPHVSDHEMAKPTTSAALNANGDHTKAFSRKELRLPSCVSMLTALFRGTGSEANGTMMQNIASSTIHSAGEIRKSMVTKELETLGGYILRERRTRRGGRKIWAKSNDFNESNVDDDVCTF